MLVEHLVAMMVELKVDQLDLMWAVETAGRLELRKAAL